MFGQKYDNKRSLSMFDSFANQHRFNNLNREVPPQQTATSSISFQRSFDNIERNVDRSMSTSRFHEIPVRVTREAPPPPSLQTNVVPSVSPSRSFDKPERNDNFDCHLRNATRFNPLPRESPIQSTLATKHERPSSPNRSFQNADRVSEANFPSQSRNISPPPKHAALNDNNVIKQRDLRRFSASSRKRIKYNIFHNNMSPDEARKHEMHRLYEIRQEKRAQKAREGRSRSVSPEKKFNNTNNYPDSKINWNISSIENKQKSGSVNSFDCAKSSPSIDGREIRSEDCNDVYIPVDDKLAIIHEVYPSQELNLLDMENIQIALLEAIDHIKDNMKIRPKFSVLPQDGWLSVTSLSKETTDWLFDTVFSLKLPIRILNEEKLNRFIVYEAFVPQIPGGNLPPEKFLLRLRNQNHNLDTTRWRIVDVIIENNGDQIFFFNIDVASHLILEEIGYRPFLNFGRIHICRNKDMRLNEDFINNL